MDKRLSYGRIVGRKVKIVKTGEIGICDYYDRYERVFYILLESNKSKYNVDGSTRCISCIREDFEVM